MASLTEKFLKSNFDETVLKEKKEKHLRPVNVDSLETPKVNKPIWENLSPSTRIKDSNLQAIQKDLLSSAIPVLKVMEQIFDAREDMNSLNAKDILDTLKDSFIFLGAANNGMIKARRDNVKRDLPKNMEGLCRDTVAFSSTNLFGDCLNNSIKEVSELNRISNTFRPRGSYPTGRNRGRGFSGRGGFSPRGRGRGGRRGTRGRGSNKRFHPYQNDKKTSNQTGPSSN